MLKKKLLSSLVLIALLAGCDTDDENEDASASLIGVWNSTCIVDDSDPDDEESKIVSYEFTETGVKFKNAIYSDVSCDELLIEITASGTYEIGQNVVTPTGVNATEIDLVFTDAESSWGVEIEYDVTFLELFVIEDTYLYFGVSVDDESEELTRPTDINFSYWAELQE